MNRRTSGTKYLRRIMSTMLCVVLVGSNSFGVLANDTATDIDPVEVMDETYGEELETEEYYGYDLENDEPVTYDDVPSDGEGNEDPANQPIIESWDWAETTDLSIYKGEGYISFSDEERSTVTQEQIEAKLPKSIILTYIDGSKSEAISISWRDLNQDFTDTTKSLFTLNATVDNKELAPNPVFSDLYVCLEFVATINNPNKPTEKYPGQFRDLNGEEVSDPKHQVKGITPEGSNINLFDYSFSVNYNGDLLPDGAKFEDYSNGINAGALLLFGGSAMREAGFWNQGSGAGRPWGKAHTNLKGIVENKLNASGYPQINLKNARNILPGRSNIQNDNWNDGIFMDIANLNHAELENAGIDAARGLSKKLLTNRGLTVSQDEIVTGNCDKASLQYLFDPDTQNDGKKSYPEVTGLFQIDDDGYYYYDARKNYAELKTDEDSNSFTLYDGPAVWRTDGGWNPITGKFDGDMSLGNFFPFDSASRVFDKVQTTDKNGQKTDVLSSSVNKTNADNKVKANHYMGMTFDVDFTQPESGKLNMGTKGKQPMTFQFSGDDDVWVYIDDVLVLDLGGVHSELCGIIDFSTGKVLMGQSWRTGGLPDNLSDLGNVKDEKTLYDLFKEALGENADSRFTTQSDGTKIFPTGTTHTLKMFYLERGNYDSSLQMRFNLQPTLYQGIKKVDQNGKTLAGAEFALYPATLNGTDGSTDVKDYEATSETSIATLTTTNEAITTFNQTRDGVTSPFSFADQYTANHTEYYILKETVAPGGYRKLPKDIVLKFNPATSMLVVANRYQTGAYASFFSKVQELANVTYGQFNPSTGTISPNLNYPVSLNSKEGGIVVAVPMLLEKKMSHDDTPADGKWQALYGSNTDGFKAIAPASRTAEEWRKAILKAALLQASDADWPSWYLEYDPTTQKLEGQLEDLPGRADRYLLNNNDGDMKMVYAIIEPSAFDSLHLNVADDPNALTTDVLYGRLQDYISKKIADEAANGKTTEEVIAEIVESLNYKDTDQKRDFAFLNTDQFQRTFRSTIYIPNERRELRVKKVDENGRGVNGVTFELKNKRNNQVVWGTTANVEGQDGMLIFRPLDLGENIKGYTTITWGEVGTEYTLKETSVPTGYNLNQTEIPVVVGIYSIYADAGTADDGVTVMAGVGKLMQTMTKYAADDMVNITLRDITAYAQTQNSGTFAMDGWKDQLLQGTGDLEIPRSMNLHYGMNAVVDYGLHDEDGGQNILPFFTTDEGYLRARVEQNTDTLLNPEYKSDESSANYDELLGQDLTSLFSLINTVVVTNNKTNPDPTGKLRVAKIVSGSLVEEADYTHNFTFTVNLNNPDGTGLTDQYYYFGEQRAGYITNGGTLSLRHDEAVTILGLPAGTNWSISEINEQSSGWNVSPSTGTISGNIHTGETAYATFNNYKGQNVGFGDLKVTKTVSGSLGDTAKEFAFEVILEPKISGQYGQMNFKDGVATFTLRHNQSITANGLPAGTRYQIRELNSDGYYVTYHNNAGVIVAGTEISSWFNNDKSSHEGDGDVDITVNKVWQLDNGGSQTDSVTVALLRNGEEYSRVILNEQNGWKNTWTDLSNLYSWSVEELDVPQGFTSTVTQSDYTFTITNDDNSPEDPNNPGTPNQQGEPDNPDKPFDPDHPTQSPPTSVKTNVTFSLILIVLSILALVLLGIWRRQMRYHR